MSFDQFVLAIRVVLIFLQFNIPKQHSQMGPYGMLIGYTLNKIYFVININTQI